MACNVWFFPIGETKDPKSRTQDGAGKPSFPLRGCQPFATFGTLAKKRHSLEPAYSLQTTGTNKKTGLSEALSSG